MAGFDKVSVRWLEWRLAQLDGEVQELQHRRGEVDGIARRDIEAALHDKEEVMAIIRREIARRA